MGSPVHQMIEAANTYCDLVDRDRKRIADWYGLEDTARWRGVSAERLYFEHHLRARNDSTSIEMWGLGRDRHR